MPLPVQVFQCQCFFFDAKFISVPIFYFQCQTLKSSFWLHIRTAQNLRWRQLLNLECHFIIIRILVSCSCPVSSNSYYYPPFKKSVCAYAGTPASWTAAVSGLGEEASWLWQSQCFSLFLFLCFCFRWRLKFLWKSLCVVYSECCIQVKLGNCVLPMSTCSSGPPSVWTLAKFEDKGGKYKFSLIL